MHNNYEVNNKMRMKINITSNLIDKLKSYKTLTSSANSTRNQSIIKFDSLQKSFLASTKHKRKEVHKKANQYNNFIYYYSDSDSSLCCTVFTRSGQTPE